eukprot:gene20223-22199_t
MAAQERRMQNMISTIKNNTELKEMNQLRTRTPPFTSGKKRKLNSRIDVEDDIQSQSPASITGQDASEIQEFVFKNPNFEHSAARGGKKRTWRNLKQVVSQERTLVWPENSVTYGSIDAPLSFKPGKKYSDISGFHAKYTDPQTKLRYSTSAEFRNIRQLSYDRMQGYLSLRNASFVP